jgi:hypothetical protein
LALWTVIDNLASHLLFILSPPNLLAVH